jgi:hypothetical protein
MSATETPRPDAIEKKGRANRSWQMALISSLVVLFGACGVEGYFLYSAHKRITREIRAEKWERLVAEYYLSEDSVVPQVGIIQFMRTGLSVTLNSANYTTNGLELTGELGNARNVNISSITLHVTARHPMYSLREKYLAGQDLSYTIQGNNLVLGGAEIGNGQTAVGDLAPGRKQFFSVTIPNVKQTDEQPDLHVYLSGERYSY